MTNLKIELKAVEVGEPASITGVRWLRGEKGPILVASAVKSNPSNQMDSTMTFTAISAPRAELLRLPQSVPSIPDWDVALETENGPVFVYTDAGGAINALLLHRGIAGSVLVTTGTPFESFHRPRFIKYAADLPLTAIQLENKPIVFTGLETSGYRNHYALAKYESALVIAHKEGYSLFGETAVPGAPRGNLITRGVLHRVELDRNFKPRATPPSKPLGDSVVFEYDVESAGGELAILATTETGTLLKTGEMTRHFAEANPQAMTSPSILYSAGQIYAALLEGALTRNARILVAQVNRGH